MGNVQYSVRGGLFDIGGRGLDLVRHKTPGHAPC